MERNNVVKQCVSMAVACWNNYSDTPLSAEQIKYLQEAMENLLPLNLSTDKWDNYYNEYRERVNR